VFRLSLVLLLVVACLVLAAGAVLSVWLPQMAAEQFGPPSPALGLPQRAMYAFRLLSNQESLLSAVDPGGQPRQFLVVLGESVDSIAARLEEERFIANADAFRTYLVYAGLDTGVQAGAYRLSSAMTTVEIAHELQDSVPEEVAFVILPGWRAEEIADALPTSGLAISREEFLRLVQDPPAEALPAGLPPVDSLEGYLFPGAYQVNRGITASGLAALFTARFSESVSQDVRDGFAGQGLDLHQAVTLASIVEREAVVVEEQPLIASVFLNRLAAGMRLESDPTAQYALGYDTPGQTWWKNPLSLDDLQVDSRYNTYVYAGLPPGPISNPGLDALRAVAYPAQTEYFYFRAQCDGSGRHFFAVSYEEHLNNACP
jgi:UPF0755 protein